MLEIMETNRKTFILTIGILLVIGLISIGLLQQQVRPAGMAENELLLKYKSTIPMVTAPLHILAKGMKLVDN
jgi:hypothetical protein